MCTSGGLDDGRQVMDIVDRTNLTGSQCRKCNEANANVVLQSKFPYCRTCFISMVSHKYRSTLGKSKEMNHGDRVLVAYSGGHSSVCLLSMIKEALEDGKKKRIKTETVVLFVDELPLSKMNSGERVQLISEVAKSLERYDFQKYYSPLESVFHEVPTITVLDDNLKLHESFERSLNLFDNCKTTTSALDLLKKVRHRLLYSAAKVLNCNKVFLADTSDHLAVNIITDVALGRGAQLPFNVGFKDCRFGDIDFLRPLQECSKKEVAIYNRYQGLRPVSLPKMSTKANKFESIQKLTEDFVSNLTVSFPSTAHTIVATAKKLTPNNGTSQRICSLCQIPIKETIGSLSSSKATELSGLVSSLGPSGFDDRSLATKMITESDSRCGKKDGGCCCNKSSNDGFHLCYSCRLIASEYGDLNSWPKAIRQKAEEESRLAAMRTEIQDFLL